MALDLNNAATVAAALNLGLSPCALAATALTDGIDPQVIVDSLGAAAYREAADQIAATAATAGKAAVALHRASTPSKDKGRGAYSRMILAGYRAILASYAEISATERNPYGGAWPATLDGWALAIQRKGSTKTGGLIRPTGSLGINVATDPYSTICREERISDGTVFLGLRWDGRQTSRGGALRREEYWAQINDRLASYAEIAVIVEPTVDPATDDAGTAEAGSTEE